MRVSVEKPGTPEELAHHGVKGMKWGVRSATAGGKGIAKGARAGGRAARAVGRGIDNTQFELGAHNDRTHTQIASKAGKKLREQDLPGIKAKHGDYGKLRNRAKHPFSPEAKAYRADVKTAYLKHLEETANSMTNIRGTRRYTLKESGKPNSSRYTWKVSTEAVQHADGAGTFTVRPIFDSEGYIVDIEFVSTDLAQSAIDHILDRDGALKLMSS